MQAKNPVIYSDFPDPDVIWVKDTYYLVTTTMHFFPGAQILSSKDLVNWQHEGYVYDTFGETEGQKLQGGAIYGQGMWAPTMRYHDGVFHVLFSCNDTKSCYHYMAESVKDPWKQQKVQGFYHDASLLFEDDGSVYLVHGNRDIYLTQMKKDLSGPLEGGLNRRLLHDDCEGLGWEGSHIHKIGGVYYLCNIHWPKGHMRTQSVHRSDSLMGDFVGGDVLQDDLDGSFRGVAQGGIIDTPDGKWFMMLFQDHGAQGRMPVLVPFQWENGMPKMEKVPLQLSVPVDETLPKLYTSDALKGGISPLWQWNHEPDWSKIAFTGQGLQLTCGGLAGHVEQARNTLTQKCFGKKCSCAVQVDGKDLQEGDFAGICALQGCFAQLCMTIRDGKRFLSFVTRQPGENDDVWHSRELPREKVLLPVEQTAITLRADFDFTCDQVLFFYETKEGFVPVGEPHQLYYRLDHFTGCRIGLCAFNGNGIGGTALFSDFVYRVEEEINEN